MLKLCVLNVNARLLYCKANLILSLSTCQRTRQNVFKYLLSNNLKIRKESPNSSLEEKAYNGTTAPPSLRKGKRKEKKKPTKTICPLHPTRPPPKLPKISVVNKSPNEEEAFKFRSQVEEEAKLTDEVNVVLRVRLVSFFQIATCFQCNFLKKKRQIVVRLVLT